MALVCATAGGARRRVGARSGPAGSAPGEAERESARAARSGAARGLIWGHRKRGGRVEREHRTGPEIGGRPSARGLELRAAELRGGWSGGIGGAERAESASTGRAPRYGGGRARERSCWPTGSGGIGGAERAERASTGRAPRSYLFDPSPGSQ